MTARSFTLTDADLRTLHYAINVAVDYESALTTRDHSTDTRYHAQRAIARLKAIQDKLTAQRDTPKR